MILRELKHKTYSEFVLCVPLEIAKALKLKKGDKFKITIKGNKIIYEKEC